MCLALLSAAEKKLADDGFLSLTAPRRNGNLS
jgi:hypothetical protein